MCFVTDSGSFDTIYSKSTLCSSLPGVSCATLCNLRSRCRASPALHNRAPKKAHSRNAEDKLDGADLPFHSPLRP